MKRNVFILVCCLCLVATSSRAMVQSWTQRYNGPGNYFDVPVAIGVDTNNNAYVTGYSSDGGVYNYTTIAYSSSGTPLWTNRYVGPGGYDAPRAMTVSPGGNVYVTGASQNSTVYPYNMDYFTIAYSNNGSIKWSARYDGPYGSDDSPSAIRVDTNGNVFVTGWCTTGDSNNCDFATIKYSDTGLPLWTNRSHGTIRGADRATAMALDGNGNAFVTGFSIGGSAGNNFATVAYSNNGVALWTNRYAGPGADDDEPAAIAVDGNGNVFVTGFAGPGAKLGIDYLTLGYSNAGLPLWTNRFSGPGSGSSDSARAIAVDALGKVYVTGGSYNGSNNDFATIAYSNTGQPLWTNRYDGPTNKDDAATALIVDAAGIVYVCGSSSGGSSSDYAIVAYADTGLPVWTNRYAGPAGDTDVPYAMALDSRRNLYVTGESWGITAAFDYVTIKYSLPASIPLGFQSGSSKMVLNWSSALFNLQCAASPVGPFTNVPATSPYTNACTNAQMFFRLQAY